MRVIVDDDVCGGHGVCFGLCPEVFDLTDDGYAVVLVDTVPAEHVDVVRDAVGQCPSGAITIED
ncbi:MAG: ferredoxin [Acidimicrobiia bacterium]|nr:ferredoxin [Acidimicrobiia bacterium]